MNDEFQRDPCFDNYVQREGYQKVELPIRQYSNLFEAIAVCLNFRGVYENREELQKKSTFLREMAQVPPCMPPGAEQLELASRNLHLVIECVESCSMNGSDSLIYYYDEGAVIGVEIYNHHGAHRHYEPVLRDINSVEYRGHRGRINPDLLCPPFEHTDFIPFPEQQYTASWEIDPNNIQTL